MSKPQKEYVRERLDRFAYLCNKGYRRINLRAWNEEWIKKRTHRSFVVKVSSRHLIVSLYSGGRLKRKRSMRRGVYGKVHT